VAAKAGLDPATSPVSWDEVIEAARRTGTTVAVQAKRYEGYVVWINALIASAGGTIVENPEAPSDDVVLGIESPAGSRAAEIIHDLATGGVAGPSLSTADEGAARALFQGPTGGFMLNWPYVWRAANKAAEGGSLAADVLADIDWARYPQATAGEPSAPPLGGIAIGIGAYSKHQDLAVEAVKCLTSLENQTYYFLHDGNPAARPAVFDDAEVLKEFPMAPIIKESLEAAAPRPTSPFYSDISTALQRSWHPPGKVDPQRTPESSTALILGVLKGEKLL
jgi:multiple sugar transport system substrate-binding protein